MPPPSLLDTPKQVVEVEIGLYDVDEFSPAAELRIVDLEGEADETVSLPQGAGTATVIVEGLTLDLTMNCLELWLQEGEVTTDHVLYHATINADDQTVDVVQGCL